MATATLVREARAALKEAKAVGPASHPALTAMRLDPATVMTWAGVYPDRWQRGQLTSRARRRLLLCSRQSGKSTVAAALAVRTALQTTASLTLLVSPTLRQSAELFRKCMSLYGALGRPVPTLRPRDSLLSLELANGSRVVSLPGVEATVRSFSGVALLVIDEAARVPDPLYFALRPMLATSGGTLVAVSSAYAKQGWFYSEWTGAAPWERVKVTAPECPRISAEFLAEERQALGSRWYSMEYECTFGDAVDSVFAEADIERALGGGAIPLFGA